MVKPLIRHVLIQYLLGELPLAERERIERAYFVNQEVWEALAETENDLIESYLYGRLSQREREQFENYFLVSRQKRWRVALVEVLKEFARTPE